MSPASGPGRAGSYEILGTLGAGGMGEVYRARDPRLGRDIALKILPAEFAADPERLRRFEREARAASALNHPSIVTIYEIGGEGATRYIAMELIDGKTIRQLVQAGPLPIRTLLGVATQVADGLARAHEAGIVHRDVKPDNIMVSRDGVAKILDFGLAKRTTERGANDQEATSTLATEPGSVVGTVRYMSPEQAAGRIVDFRSDQFSFGSVLYEMATGKQAFAGDTKVDTLSAILHQEPEPVARVNPKTPAPLRWIIERCLAKEPRDRYAATQDLARDLADVRAHLSEVSGSTDLPTTSWSALRRLAWGSAVVVAGAGLLVAGVGLGRGTAPHELPTFRQLTFRNGFVSAARFAPDSDTIVYSAEWDRHPHEIYVHRLGTFESRPLGILGDLNGLSRSGELLLTRDGTLSRMGIASSGGPREILENVSDADWSPDGAELAVVREVQGRSSVEYPVGHVLFQESAGVVGYLRVSRDGARVAFVDYPVRIEQSGSVVVVGRDGKAKVWSKKFNLIQGLSWSPDGREVWFTGAATGDNAALQAVDPSGRTRILARSMGSMDLKDVSSSGRALVTDYRLVEHMRALAPGEEKERDLTWLDMSLSRAISNDGRTVLFLESGDGGGPGNSVFIRGTNGSPAVRLGEGAPWALSPDGRLAAAFVGEGGHSSLVLYPTGSGANRSIPLAGIEPQWADWLPDGKRLLFGAGVPGGGPRVYLQDVDGGPPKPVTPEGYLGYEGTLSPEGQHFVAKGPDGAFVIYPVEGGRPAVLPGLTPSDRPRGWSLDGRFLFVTGERYTIPRTVYRVDVASGAREVWKELGPETGAVGIHVTPDGRSYVYSYVQGRGDLYLVEGLK